jgi:hypothetical protein
MIRSSRLEFCGSRSRGKSLVSFYNRVYCPSGHNTPSDQLLGSVSLVQTCWITSCNASTSTRLGPPFFNSSSAIESAPAALFFRYFRDASISSWLGKSMTTPSSPIDVLVAPIRNPRSIVLQNVLTSSPFLGRLTCGLNGRLTSFRRL